MSVAVMRLKSIVSRHMPIVLFCLMWTVACADIVLARQVSDEIGRVVHVADTPQRIVSLAPGITETLFELGLEEKIVGVTSYCDWPEAARGKPNIGGFTNPSIEKIVSLKPDLVIATMDGNRKDIVTKLERIGLTVYVVNPYDTETILAGILHIGDIAARRDAAVALVATLRKRLNAIRTQTQNRKKPRVFFQIGLDPLITAGGGTLISEVIVCAAGLNIAEKDKARYPRYSAEGVMAGSPDIILFAPMAQDREFTAVKKFWGRYGQIPAVKNNRIYPVNTDVISRASPRVFDAIEDIALIFHPDIKIRRDRTRHP